MITFSPFGKDSGGFVTTAGLGLSFAGVAAQRAPYPQKRTIEITTKTKSDLANFILIVPPNNIFLRTSTPLRLEMNVGYLFKINNKI